MDLPNGASVSSNWLPTAALENVDNGTRGRCSRRARRAF
jgi:hypothetical protein